MIITPQALDGIFDGLSMAFNRGYESVSTAWARVAMKVDSSHAQETYGWMGLVPGMREWIGPRVVQNLSAHGFTIVNRKFEQTYGVPREKIEDDTYGLFSPLFSEMGRAAAEMPDTLVFGLLADGFTQECYDGQPFFDADHPVQIEAGLTVTVSNMQAGEGEPWFLLDTSRAVRPMVYQERVPFGRLVRKDRDEDENVFSNDQYVYGSRGRGNAGFGLWQLAFASRAPLTATNYEAARVAMMTQPGESGRKLNVKPNVLITGPVNEGAAMRLLNNGSRLVTEINGSALDAPVAIQNEWAGTAEPIITQWLVA